MRRLPLFFKLKQKSSQENNAEADPCNNHSYWENSMECLLQVVLDELLVLSLFHSFSIP